ncbi:M15 family metallopeptidase [Gordonia sp. TBRC 11910]|uniref:D-alanyl-D-alanine dipeptidase n=1 Tax=Gordonia asplenii TaxID=2725283 RepID=A0A848KNF0_9ACTN|nr:M15 family metallopeptidase [Gordonia asplenii]NMN99751.1 M15 family metallopeptidase [Gordonia asplenii]
MRRLLLPFVLLATALAIPAPASAAPVPPVSATAAAEGLLDVRSVVPDAVVDLRYATPDNFVKQQLYPTGARCLVHQSMAPGLRTAADTLRAQGDRLVFWDCYRPHSVQVHMYQVVPDANWVAKPTAYARSHEAGRSVDVTLAAADGRRLEMGTGFDDFTARAHAYATDGVDAAAVANRARLRTAMQAGGLSPYSGEWWHFDGPGAGVDRPILRAAVN